MTNKLPVAVALAALVFAGACHKNKPPVARPQPPVAPPTTTAPPNRPPAPPEPVPDRTPIPPEPKISDDPLSASGLDEINKNSPFQPVFFALDHYEVDGAAQQALNANAAILKKYPTWVITI